MSDSCGQMCWLRPFGSETKILHLRLQPNAPWQPYTRVARFAVTDYGIPGGSKGMATFHALYKAGWELIVVKDSYHPAIDLPDAEAA